MRVTVHDVARLAGVSTKTVSRVVNRQGEISEATRARVQAAIDQLGYRPNLLARGLVSRRSHMIGVVAWGIDYYGPSRVIVGIEAKAHQLGYTLFLSLIPHPGDARVDILDTLISHRVDGIIWMIPEVGSNQDWISSISQDDLPPLVCINGNARPGLVSVSIDNRQGGFVATQHLIEQGRRRIGLISGPENWWEAEERSRGWQQALEGAGIGSASKCISATEWSIQAGADAMQSLLQRHPGIDALFAESDHIALGALHVLLRSGRKVPGDVALVGFDDIPESSYFQPPLSTVHQPLSDLGEAAVEHLVDLIGQRRRGESPHTRRPASREPYLIVRASSSAAGGWKKMRPTHP